MGTFNLKKLKDVEVKEQYRVKISNWFANLGNLVQRKQVTLQWLHS